MMATALSRERWNLFGANARTSSRFCTPPLYAQTKRNPDQGFSLHQLSVAALWTDAEGLSVLDAALHVFLTLPAHTSTREDYGQPVGSAAMRLPVPRQGSQQTKETSSVTSRGRKHSAS